MNLVTTEPEQEESGFASPRLGHVRWTICAMLFFATSINYMDRQVIALLKPTLQHTIGLTEINYGYIVDAFQAAYAIGLLVAGRLVDKIGTPSATSSSWGYGASPRWATPWPIPRLNSALRVSFSASANLATFPPPSRPSPSGFRKASVRWQWASSTPVRMSEHK